MTRAELEVELAQVAEEVMRMRFQVQDLPADATEIDATGTRDRLREVVRSTTLERFPERLPGKFVMDVDKD